MEKFMSWLNYNGRFIMGIDFYKENLSSHDWPEKTNVSIMNMLSSKKWIQMFKECGFKNIENWKVGKSNNWEGTLVITGTKN